MTSGKLGFWPTYPLQIETKKFMTIWLVSLTYPPCRNLDKFQKIFGDNVPGHGLLYEEILLSDDDNNATDSENVTGGDGDSLVVNRSVPEIVNGV